MVVPHTQRGVVGLPMKYLCTPSLTDSQHQQVSNKTQPCQRKLLNLYDRYSTELPTYPSLDTPIATHPLFIFIMSDLEPSSDSDHLNKFFDAAQFYGAEQQYQRWRLYESTLVLNPKFPDVVDFIGRCKTRTKPALLDHGLMTSKLFRFYQNW